MFDFKIGFGLKTEANCNSVHIGTEAFIQCHAVSVCSTGKTIGMKVHWISITSYIQMFEIEVFSHIVKQFILNDKNKIFVQVFEGAHLVVKLYQDCFGCHLPVHPERFVRQHISVFNVDAHLLKQALPLGPDCAGRVQCLKLNSDKIPYTSFQDRHKKIVNTTTRDSYFGHDMQLIAWRMTLQQMKTINEYLPPLEKT